jgi:hypothetical protein
MSARSIIGVVTMGVLAVFVACSGDSKKQETPQGPHITLADGTVLVAGTTQSFNLATNEDLEIQAQGVKEWKTSTKPETANVVVYDEEKTESRYKARFFTDAAATYVVEALFEEGQTTVEIALTPGVCDGVTCSAAGSCHTNESGYPYCDCDEGYVDNGLQCQEIGAGAGSCEVKIGINNPYWCYDYNGSAWVSDDAQDHCAQLQLDVAEYTKAYSSDPCGVGGLVGSCVVKHNSPPEYTIRFYSHYFNPTSASQYCTIAEGTFVPAETE